MFSNSTYLTCNSSSGDSDYKPHGSISNSQIAPQRKPSDTYFGELILKKAKTGESVADLIKADIFVGSTAQIRTYRKKGIKHNFRSTISFPNDYDNSRFNSYITNDTGNPVDTVKFSNKGKATERQRQLAAYSMGRGMYIEKTATGEGFMNDAAGVNKEVQSYNQGGPFVIVTFVDGTVEQTTIPGVNVPAVETYEGYYVEYLSGTKLYFYFSSDARFVDAGSTSFPIDVLPIVSFQDNAYDELPYEQIFTPEESEFIRRDKTLRGLGVDFETMSRQVFANIYPYQSYEWNRTYGAKWKRSNKLQAKYSTERAYYDDLYKELEIPPYPSDEWNKGYGRSYRSNMKNCRKNPRPEQSEFCRDNPTEQIYHDKLVVDKRKGYDSIRNITDVHFGIFASAKLLDEENCVALLYTLKDAFPLMNAVPNDNVTITRPDGTQEKGKLYKMNVHVGSLKVYYIFDDWSLCRRYGVADPIMYPPGIKSAKRNHGDYTIYDGGRGSGLPPSWDVGDKYNQRDPSYSEEHAPAFGFSTRGLLELRVQDRPDASGRPRFLELRMYGPMASHIVDVIRDGEHGKSGTVSVVGGLYGINTNDPDKPYSDVLIWPITYKAAREIRIFRRERFLRECTVINIGAIKMEEVKWYQQTWFKIVMIIVTLVLSYFFPPLGVAVGMSGVLASAAIMAVLYIVSQLVENPILKAIIQIIIILYTYDVSSVAALMNPSLLVEAAGVVVQTYIAVEMIALQKEMKEFREMVNEKQKEMDKMKKEVGMDEHNADWALYIASLAPVENADDFYSRALNTNLNGITLEGAVGIDTVVPAPQG